MDPIVWTDPTLDEDVIQVATPPIHADADLLTQQHTGEGGACELTALVSVEDFRLALSKRLTFPIIF